MEYTLRKAATVVLLRDGSKGLEVLLLKRSDELSFAPGNWVFPGGSMDEADRAGVASDLEALEITAVREANEEAAVEVGTDNLVHFMQFTTPLGKKRFETWFFIAPVDGSEGEVIPDGSEIVECRWTSPAEAVAGFEARELPMFVPTGLTLMRLARFKSVAEAVADFRATDAVKILPNAQVEGDELISLYPGDVAYEDGDWQQEGPRHRALLCRKTGYWQYEYSADEQLYPRLDGGYN